MFKGRSALAFLVRFVIVFTLLMAPWPGLREAYAACFRAGGNVLLGAFGAHGSVRFLPLSTPDPEHDTELILRDRRTGKTVHLAGDSRLYGYLPTGFVLSLILATPMGRSRRVKALILGMALVNVYVILRLAVFLAVAFSGAYGLTLYIYGPFWRGVLGFTHWVVVVSFAGWLIVPLPIWAFASFCGRDTGTLREAVQNDLG